MRTGSGIGIAGLALAAFAALVPFQGIGRLYASDFLRIGPADWVLAAGTPWLAASIWRARRCVVGSWIVRALTALALAGTVATGSLVALTRVWAPVFVVAAFLALEPAARKRVLAAAVGGGWIALALGLIGFAATAFGLLPRIRDELPFAMQGPHPVFDGMLRFSGTFGVSCQDLGDYLIVWLALLALTRSPRRQRAFGLALGTFGVLLTFASSWVALPLVLVASLARLEVPLPRLVVAAALVSTLALSAGSTWLMNFGVPGRAVAEGPCDTLDIEHHVTRISDDGSRCWQLVDTWPYPARKSNYRYAKEVAWRAFLHAPLFGIGAGEFASAARAEVETRFGPRTPSTYYASPHSVYLGVLAERGLCGFAALVLLAWVMFRAAPTAPLLHPIWSAAAGLTLVGLNADLLHHRDVWLLVAVLSACCSHAGRRMGPAGRAESRT